MKKNYLLFLILLLLIIQPALSQEQKFTISGRVKDANNGEDLIGAIVNISGTSYGAATNEYGFYSITLPPGNYKLEANYLGFQKFEKEIKVTANVTLNIELSEQIIEAQEVVITGERPDKNIQNTKIGVQEVDIKQIKKLPALFGEVDVIKNIQMLPGVQVAGEGNTGLFVRGGSTDQNLILLDEAPVYNASHLMGIFSVFNSEALKSAELYKGGIPAQHGGRLSSLLDIRTKDGNSKKFSGSGGIGTISSRLTLEGPIVKDKSSFIISGRRTYGDLFLKLSSDKGIRQTKLFFYDLNAKVNYTINDKNRVYLAGYFGRDVLGLGKFFSLNYGNGTGTLRWNHVYNSKLFSNTTLIYSTFDYAQELEFTSFGFQYGTGLKEATVKQDYNYYLNSNNEIGFGVSGTHRTYAPGIFSPTKDEAGFEEIKLDKFRSLDFAVYLSNKQKISNRLSLEYGIRYSIFSNVGKGNVFIYNGERLEENIIDTVSYGSLQNIKTYGGFEPRASGRYLLNERSSIKASYNRMIQYIHLMANSTAPLPFNVWMPSTPHLLPQKSDQVSLGYFRNFLENKIETSVEGYYKTMKNIPDFIDNAELLLNEHFETEVRSGKGWSYGLELFVKKNTGKTTGWISYTWSKTERKIPGVNNGNVYFAGYDRRHNFNFVVSHDFSKRVNLSGNWVYGSGRPITLPIGKYQYGQWAPSIYPERNFYRMEAYHRLDIAVTIQNKKKENSKWESNWNFSIYNLYAKKNPFTILTRDAEDRPGVKEVVKIYFPAPIPSITYNFSF